MYDLHSISKVNFNVTMSATLDQILLSELYNSNKKISCLGNYLKLTFGGETFVCKGSWEII